MCSVHLAVSVHIMCRQCGSRCMACHSLACSTDTQLRVWPSFDTSTTPITPSAQCWQVPVRGSNWSESGLHPGHCNAVQVHRLGIENPQPKKSSLKISDQSKRQKPQNSQFFVSGKIEKKISQLSPLTLPSLSDVSVVVWMLLVTVVVTPCSVARVSPTTTMRVFPISRNSVSSAASFAATSFS